MTVLQTVALPLGYITIIKKYCNNNEHTNSEITLNKSSVIFFITTTFTIICENDSNYKYFVTLNHFP
jgi:hypothetical protein